MRICDYAEIGELKLVIECNSSGYYFTPYYRGDNAMSSLEGIKALLNLYNMDEVKSLKGKKFVFRGELESAVEKISPMGYSTNYVVAIDDRVIKTYRKIGSREPEVMIHLENIAPRVLGWGKYDGKFIQIVTERIVGMDMGRLFYESYKNFVERGEIIKPPVKDVAQVIAMMHKKLEKFGVEKICEDDIVRWRNYVESMIKFANVDYSPMKLFMGMRDKEKILTHQDLHLSQMLLRNGRIYIVDFEGEPLRKRRDEKLQPVRDISTIARAIGYITRGAWDEWERMIVENIYEEYRRKCNYSFDRIDYADWIIEKAIYEINYELKYRPEMVKIPRKGLENAINYREELK